MVKYPRLKRIQHISLFTILGLCSCGIDDRPALAAAQCDQNISLNTSYSEVRLLAEKQLIQVTEDLIIEGYVISSDQEGNFFNTIHIQEGFEDHSLGFQVEMELADAHLFYPEGSKIYIKLKGLYVGRSGGMYKIGSAYNSFGTLNVGRIPTLMVDQHILPSCEEIQIIQPKNISLDSLSDGHLNTYVAFDQMEFEEEELGMPYAIPKEETERILVDCRNNQIGLITSGYSEFHSETLPEGSGSIKGVLLKERSDYKIRISRLGDIRFKDQRCRDLSMPDTSDRIYISEIADPENDSDARFVELYNSSDKNIQLDGWELRRYTNERVEVSSAIDLGGMIIKAKGTLVISSDAKRFQEVFGITSDLEGGTNSAADSNGDDNVELADPFDKVVDRFGIPGEDGTGTSHEFEDGGAFRKPEVMRASPEFDPNQWVIYNDSGGEGTILHPLKAPEDYSPGIH